MARIIAGIAKNTQLKTPKQGTRPIMDRAKAALFSILFDWIEDAIVLDLYAGSGSLGIEALSRGARFAVFVDNSEEAIECIEENLDKANLYKYAEIVSDTVEGFINSNKEKFDLIFIDPPYEDTKMEQISMSQKCLKEDGLIVIKHAPKFKADEKVGELQLVDSRKYGENALSFYRKIDTN